MMFTSLLLPAPPCLVKPRPFSLWSLLLSCTSSSDFLASFVILTSQILPTYCFCLLDVCLPLCFLPCMNLSQTWMVSGKEGSPHRKWPFITDPSIPFDLHTVETIQPDEKHVYATGISCAKPRVAFILKHGIGSNPVNPFAHKQLRCMKLCISLNPSTFDLHIPVNVELSTRGEPLPSFAMPSEKYANLYKQFLQGAMTPKCKKRNVTDIKLSPFTLHKNSTPLFSCCGTVKGLFHFILDRMTLQLTREISGLARLQYQSCPACSH